jgi:hypothetical protein
MRGYIRNDLDDKKDKHDDPASHGIIFPGHYHKSIVHRDVERDIWRQLSPIHCLSERNLQYPVIQGFDRQECQKDHQKDGVPRRLMFLLDEEDRIKRRDRQQQIYPSDSLKKIWIILTNKKDEDEDQDHIVQYTQHEIEWFKHFEAPGFLMEWNSTPNLPQP